MKMKCTILKQITAMVLCITLLSSQVVVAGEEGFYGDEITDSFDDSISDTGDEFRNMVRTTAWRNQTDLIIQEIGNFRIPRRRSSIRMRYQMILLRQVMVII